MTDDKQREVFMTNLNRILEQRGKSQKEVADYIGVSPQTFNTWCKGIAIPRMGKIQKLADYFEIPKSFLIDEQPANKHYDISTIEKILAYAKGLSETNQLRLLERAEELSMFEHYEELTGEAMWDFTVKSFNLDK